MSVLLAKPQPVGECVYCKKKSMTIDDKHGEHVCTICGVVSKVPIYDTTSEYRNFAVEHGVKDKSRTSYSGDGDTADLGTSVELSGSKSSKLLNQWTQRYTTDPKTQNIRKSVRRIRELAARLDLSKAIANSACETYKQALDEGLTKNYKKAAIDAVCVYDGCVQNGKAMKREDIIKECDDITVKEFENVRKAFSSILHGAASPAEMAKRYSTKLYNRPFIQDTILALGKKVEEWGILTGKQPDSFAGAVIEFINKLLPPNLKVESSKIATVCGVSGSTIAAHLLEIEGLKEQALRIPEVKDLLQRTSENK